MCQIPHRKPKITLETSGEKRASKWGLQEARYNTNVQVREKNKAASSNKQVCLLISTLIKPPNFHIYLYILITLKLDYKAVLKRFGL
jgi:hypothetical protein